MKSLKELFTRKVRVYEAPYNGELKNSFGITKSVYFDSVPSFGEERTTFAYIGIPSSEMPENGYPAVVLVHGGGGCAYFEWVEYWNSKGYVAISFDCVGRQFGGLKRLIIDPDYPDGSRAQRNPRGRTVLPDDSGSFEYNSDNYVDSWTFYNEANIVLAHNILLDMDIVDSKNTFITGISWGGVLTAISSGIDDRFRAFAPVYGTGHLLESPIYRDKKPKMSETPEKWVKYFDPKSFVSDNYRPILFTLGADDQAFSLDGAGKTYQSSKGKKTFSYRLNLPHHHRWRDEESMVHISKFFNSFSRMQALPFEVLSEKYENGIFEIEINNPSKVKNIYFNYTTSNSSNSLTWEWKRSEISRTDSRIYMSLPEGTRYSFFELVGEEENFVLSSSLLIV